jgi:hypothetical protein
MAKIANVSLSNSFDTWRTRSNEAFDRLSQFAINNSSLYANTLTANVSFLSKGTTTLGDSTNDLTTIAGRATVGTNLTVSGNTTSNKVVVTSSITGSAANATFNKVTATSLLSVTGNTTLGDAASDRNTVNGLLTLNHSGSVSKNFTISGNTVLTGLTSLNQTIKTVTVSATAATGNVNFDVLTQGILYYTTNASANWTVNVRGDSGIALNSVLSTGREIEIRFLAKQGGTGRWQTSFGIDGTTITPRWEGGSAPSSGSTNAIDEYTYKIIKTASSTYTVMASKKQFG